MPENNPKIIKQLPPGDYSVTPSQTPKVLKTLPKGDYSVTAPHIDNFVASPEGYNDTSKIDDIINNLNTNTEDDKKVIKNLAIAHSQGRATKEDLANAIMTVQGQHPIQDGGRKYYMKEENGVFKPIPLGSGEKPPKEYDVNSIWGSQESANDDGVLTSAAKHLVNGVIGAAEGVANLPQIAYGAATGEELPWYQAVKNSANYLKFKTPESEQQGQIFDTKDLKGAEDFFDPSRYDFSKNNVQGAVLSGLESITSFLVGAKGIGTAAKTLGAVGESAGLISEGSKTAQALAGSSNAGKLGSAFAGSYMVNYDEALQAAEDAGLTGQNKYAFASVATIPTALLEMVGGTEGMFVRNQLARTGKKEMFQSLAKGIEKDTEGKLTKESLEGLYNATTTAASKLNKTFAREVGTNIAGEAGTEAAQQFALNSAKNIYDSVSGEEKFKTDPFSLESFGDYVNNAIAGGLGAGGPALVGVSQKRKMDRLEKQSNNAYNIVKQGPEAIHAFNSDIDNLVANGELTEQQAHQAKFKVGAYNEYYNQVKGLDLNDETKKKAFELSFNIEGIKDELPKESEIANLSPIEHAKVQGKKEIIKGLQKELDAIILKENVKKETTVGSDTASKVIKDEEKKVENNSVAELRKRYKTENRKEVNKVKEFADDLRNGVSRKTKEDLQFYDNNKEAIESELKAEIKPEKSERRKNAPKFDQKDANGNYEFNKQKPLEKKEILHDYFDEHPELGGEMQAHIEQGQNNVWQLDLGDKRYVQFGRAVVPDKYTGEIKNFPKGKETKFDSDGREMTRYTDPVIVKIHTIKGTREDRPGKPLRIINVYNKQTGKYIVSVKEREKGDSNYHSGEIDQMKGISEKGIVPAKEVKAPIIKKPIKEIAKHIISESEKTSLFNEGYSEKDINNAEKASNEVLNASNIEAIEKLHKIGLFNSVGNISEWRPNIGLSTTEFNTTLKQIKAGKETATTNKLNHFIDKIKDTGLVEMVGLSGGQTEKSRMPLHRFLLGEKTERELSPEETNEELSKEAAREQVFAETGDFQKESHRKGDIEKVVERIKKSLHKVIIVHNTELKDKDGKPIAGRVIGNRLDINPDYAGIDTPIHEAGHILIDAIGYDNKVIQAGIKQLKTTDLWVETKDKYPELNEEQLGKEVLAEAIGREGANIFDSEASKSKFKAILDYIFSKLKQLLGIDKNVAKSLAKQIIGGVNTEQLTGKNNTEQLQKPKKPFKKLEEMSTADLGKKLTMSLETYRENVLGRSLEQIRKDIQLIDAEIAKETDPDAKAELQDIKDAIKKEEKKDAAKWFAYKEDVALLSSIMSENRLEDMPDDKLLEAYNLIQSRDFQDKAKDPKLNQLKLQVAYRMFVERKAELSGLKGYVEEQSNKKDIAGKDILMKGLAHFTENEPELQKFNNIFEEGYFGMQKDNFGLKTQLETLGKEVIKDKNKSLGITGKVADAFSSDNAKYFEYLEHPEGRYYTLEEAKEKGFSLAQTKFLKFMLQLNELRNSQMENMSDDEVNNEVLKVDKGVKEAFRTEGLLQAFSSYIGNGFNVRHVRIPYKGVPMSYGEIEQKLINDSKTASQKAKALGEMAYYQLMARRQLKKGVNIDQSVNPLEVKDNSEYNLSTNGQLRSKFNKPRDPGRGYSKDFYAAAHSFIDDYTHTKHMGPILPYIQSIEHLNRFGYKEHGVKNNVAEWAKEWTDLHIFKKEKPGKLGPELDAFFKLMRKLTSLNVMAFAYKAGGFNIAMGVYNSIRQESLKEQTIGIKRLVSDNQKAQDIVKKYHAVSIDFESNPKLHAGKFFDFLAHGLTRYGEYFVQSSIFLGLMNDDEFNSFEYKTNADGIKELVVKPGVDEKELEKKVRSYITRIANTQGRYSEKDRRNYQNGEFGKVMAQFRVWLPDAFKQRFGKEYIDSYGQVHKGSYRAAVDRGFGELIADIKKDGIKGLVKSKEGMANIKGLMTIAAFMSLRLAGGDDDKRKKGDAIDQAMSNLLFIFDVDNLKFTVETPAAALGTLNKFVKVMQDAMNLDTKHGLNDLEKAVPYSKPIRALHELVTED